MGRTLLLALLVFSASVLHAESDDWVIGLDADMSSVAKDGGVAIRQGMELAIAEINANGGVLGKPLRIEVRDHRGNPARGIGNIRAFGKLDNLLAVVGGVHTPVAIAELPLIHELPVIYLDPWAAGTPIIKNDYNPNYAFRLSVRDEWAGEVILREAKKDNCPSITLLLERTGWGRSNETSMTAAGKALQLPIDGVEWFNWNSDILDTLVNTLAQKSVECIALVANTPEGVGIVQAVSELPAESRPRIYSHWGITGGNFTEQIGLEALAKVKLKYLQTIAFNAPKTSKGEQLVASFEAAYGKHEGHNSFNGVTHAYDLVHLLALAVEQAGTGDVVKVRNSLEKLDVFEGAMKTYQRPFAPDNHEALTPDDYVLLQFNAKGFGEQ